MTRNATTRNGADYAPRMEAITMPCKHCYDDYCTRHDCPYCAEWCPVMEHPEEYREKHKRMEGANV